MPAARRVFEEADDALGFPLSRLCFEGPEDQLKLTENTQPALLTVSMAAFEVLQRAGLGAGLRRRPQPGRIFGAGGGGKPAIRRRRAAGAQARPVYAGSRAGRAWAPWRRCSSCRKGKLDAVLEQAAQGEVVSAANLNSPEQVVIAGHAGAVGRAMELAKAAGARRAVLLPVSAPFHCALMKPAQERLRADLDATDFRDLSCPLVNNWQAREIRTGAEAREGLYQQVPNPVRWLESIRHLAGQGVGRFVEVGAGGVLTGLLRAIDASLAGLKFGEPPELDALAASGWLTPK